MFLLQFVTNFFCVSIFQAEAAPTAIEATNPLNEGTTTCTQIDFL